MAVEKWNGTLLPDWPALMSAEMAARYLSLDENSLGVVTAAAGIHPVDLGLDLHRWRRRDLDRLVSGLPLKVQAPPLAQPQSGGLDEEALERLILRVQERIKRPEKLAMSIAEAASLIGLSRSTLWKMAKDGQLRTVKIGKRALFLRSEIDELLASRPRDAAPPAEAPAPKRRPRR
ncbi:helix-turn-helix transcriptional regulator [Phenylobacterium montanum]|uniref:Helix-turn-helix domain-containing protein n=1 Tax=Phenylobacterium montanum TaxID=2823693 RepID=A0A975FVS5_9CAUL|nr:helix-turn-helix domain-containing protein [Caulobacter sp. S6]QUD86046.1 helix-turn-helix domain-containing protein [Caulobacter sp. S6]